MVIVGTGDGYETLHIMVGNDYFPTATGIGDILQISNLRFKSLYFRRTCVDKNQITDDGNQSTDFLTFLYANLVLHGNETTHFFLFKQTHSIRLSTVRGTHRIPYFSLFIRFHVRGYFRKGCSPGALKSLHTLEFQSLANTLCKIQQALCSSCQRVFYSSSMLYR